MSQLQVTGEAKIRTIQGPVVANSGVISALNGAASQYVRGDGTLADFPTSTGGGSSVSYYLNSSVSQGTIGGNAYRQLSKTPISGAGTDITASSNGYIANYITDANDPSLLEVPAGNFNCEFYFSVNSNAHNPYVYAELYKYDGTTFTLLGSNQAIPEYLINGTTLSAYYFAIPVAVATLNITDRLAIRIYANVDTRVVTLHTENGHLCQVVTTFSKGLTSLNNLTKQVQFLGTGTSGTDFNISSATATHTFNLPVASASNTGKLSSTDWSTFNAKQAALSFTAPLNNTSNTISIPVATSLVDGYLDNLDWVNFNTAYNRSLTSAAVTGTTTKTLTLNQQDGGTITASWTDINTDAVTSVFGRTGAVVAVSGDYNTSQVTENINLYFTNARARLALSFTAGSGAYNSTTGVITIPTNTNQLTNGASFITLASLSAGTGIIYNNTTGVITSTITQYTDTLARAALSFTAGSGAYNSTTGVITIPTNNNQITNGSNYITLGSLSSSATGLTYTNTTGVFSLTAGYSIPTTASQTTWDTAYTNRITSLTTTGSSGSATLVSNVLNVPTYTLAGLGGVSSNIYTADGTLTSNRTINAGGYSLTINPQTTFNPSVTAASAIARGTYLTPTLIAAANNDVLVGLDINPTFTNGAFTGVSNVGIRTNNSFTYLGGTLRVSGTTSNPSGAGGFFVFDGSEMTNFAYDYTASAYRALAYNGSLFRILIAGTERARFSVTNGNFLLNTTTDAGYKLDVNGTARVQGTFSALSSIPNGIVIDNSSINPSLQFWAGVQRITLTRENNDGLTFSASGFAMHVVSGGTLIGGANRFDLVSSAQLQVNSTTKGFLPPRMTSAQRTAISSPATGLIVYQTDGTEGLWVYTSTGWREFTFI
jgi:hypothetical protein